MNKLLSSTVLLAVIMGAPVAALAGDATSSTTPSVRATQNREEMRKREEEMKRKLEAQRKELENKRKQERDALESKSQAMREKMKERLSEARKKQVGAWWARNARRLAAIIERELKIADRISKRLDAAAAQGKDVSTQKAALNTAKEKIATAKRTLADATAQVEGIIANNTKADAIKKLHDLSDTVMGTMRDAHKALVDAIASLKSLRPSPSPSASPVATAI